MPTHLRLQISFHLKPSLIDLIFYVKLWERGERVIVMTANIYIILTTTCGIRAITPILWMRKLRQRLNCPCSHSYKWWSQDSNTGILGPSRVYAIEHQALLYISVLLPLVLGSSVSTSLTSVCCHHWLLQLLPPAPSPLLLCVNILNKLTFILVN